LAAEVIIGNQAKFASPARLLAPSTKPNNRLQQAMSDQEKIVNVSFPRQDIAVLTLDAPGSAANILDKQLFAELDSAMNELVERKDLNGVVLVSAKPRIFVAGADLKQIQSTLDWPDELIVNFCERGREVMKQFNRCPFISVAAMHGAAVGGGLELAMWCDLRVASDDRATKLGLPEVNLGLVPGWAGTVRLPRLTSFGTAVEMTATAKLIGSNEAKEIGLVDEVVSKDGLVGSAIRMIDAQIKKPTWRDRRRELAGPVSNTGEIKEVVAQTAKQIVNNKDKVFLYAPTVVLEHMERTATLSADNAEVSESQAMAQVYGSPASCGLLNYFFLVDHNKKRPGLVDLKLKPEPIKSLAIIGAGLMGKSIAEIAVRAKIDVTLLDAKPELAQSVAKELNKTTGSTSVSAATDYDQIAGADLVIESVVETIPVKHSVFPRIEQAVGPKTIIASNTSSIPIEQLATVLDRKENVCGIHFCHPELMSLVEVICGPETSEASIASAVGFVKSLRKMPVAINDGAGFVVNRMLAAMLDQSMRLLTAGYSHELIDESMREFGFLGGPFEIIDVIGADTCMYAGRTMWEHGLSCVSLSPILPKMVKTNRLGQKTGSGFYRYDGPGGPAIIDDGILELIKPYVEDRIDPEGDDALSSDEISSQILSVMALEATRILSEEIVADPRDIDLCVIDGLSFPKHQGGLLFWADRVGIGNVKELLEVLAEDEQKLAPSSKLSEMVANGTRFYG
jgi:3-hydroxyacyl-CoA dehydrogenase/enoyl-CoA hydratase/carnithine racemase